jgi:hypothetical protein
MNNSHSNVQTVRVVANTLVEPQEFPTLVLTSIVGKSLCLTHYLPERERGTLNGIVCSIVKVAFNQLGS